MAMSHYGQGREHLSNGVLFTISHNHAEFQNSELPIPLIKHLSQKTITHFFLMRKMLWFESKDPHGKLTW